MRLLAILSLVLFTGCLDRVAALARSVVTTSELAAVPVKVPVTREEADAFAKELAELYKAGDKDQLDALVSYYHMGSVGLKDSELSATDKENFLAGFGKASAFDASMLNAIPQPSFQFLHHREVGESFEPVFRLVLNDGGFLYYIFRLEKDSEGKVIAQDLYTSSNGQWITSVVVSCTLPEFIENVQVLIGMNTAMATGAGLEEALAAYRALPESGLKHKSFEIMAISVAKYIDDAEYLAEIERFLGYHTKCLANNAYKIQKAFILEDAAAAYEAIDAMEARVGGDPTLNLQRAIAATFEGNDAKAERFLEKSLQAAGESWLAHQHVRIEIAIVQKDFSKIAKLYRELVENWNQELDLTVFDALPDYEEFRKSTHYASLKKWYEAREATSLANNAESSTEE